MELRTPYPEVSEAIVASGASTLFSCMHCGLCTGACPWRLVPGHIAEVFNIRKVQRLGQLGLEGFESEDVIYACTTCGQCVVRCPREVAIVDNVRSMRSLLAEVGSVPASLRAVLGSLHAQGNPWSGERENRTEWMKPMEVPPFNEDMEYLLFVCCTSCYDARSQNIGRALIRLLRRAGVRFGIIGSEESCCGESVRKIGDEELFQKLARENISLFQERKVRKIITTSPHCMHTFRHEYPEMGGEFEVVHHSQLLARLVREGKLKPQSPFERKVVYHDPCYLGRHNEIYEDPRDILVAVTGRECLEMDRIRENSLCCGGGGGRVWMETDPGERFGDLRIEEACTKDAQIIATSCPYCTVMLEASCKSMGKEDRLAVRDISEILVESLE